MDRSADHRSACGYSPSRHRAARTIRPDCRVGRGACPSPHGRHREMRLRTRMLLSFGLVLLVPLALLAFGLRYEMTRRLSEDYQVRVHTVVAVIKEDLQRESADISVRLSSLKVALLNDNRFRRAAGGDESERNYLLDYAGSAM